MKIIIENIDQNMANALRRVGYHFERQHTATDEISAARDLGAGGFPRFHCYAKLVPSANSRPEGEARPKGVAGQAGNDMHINLHLDQKRPIYKGTSAHGGEYEGEVVEHEGARIKSILQR